MNCTKVLHAFGGHPQHSVMPVDLAVRLCLSQGQPLYQLLTMSPPKPRKPLCQPMDYPSRTSLHSLQHSLSSSSSPSSSLRPSEPRSCFRRDGGGLNKKRVVFADAKGLALTAVCLFIPEPSSPPATLVKPSPAKLQGQQSPSIKAQRYKLRLGFPQPMLDFKAFFARLQEMLIQLESCSVTEHSLSGTVRVCNIGCEKAVHIRLTFDSWRSHHDIPCAYMQQRYGCPDMDVFGFDVPLPQNLNPNERVEFCVFFRPGAAAAPRWDNNRGQNYRVCIEPEGSNSNQVLAARRSNTHTLPRPPSWPSCAFLNVKNSADLSSEKFIKQSWGLSGKLVPFPLNRPVK
ncbi:protein phosphatase 1 regulatory subunit 3C-B [Centroberyx gerrardi]